MEALFWISAAIVGYVYLGYPAVIWLLGRLFGRAPVKTEIQPHVSVLVAAYNEAAVIEDKIRNLLALDYPAGRLELVIASDGSTDGTNERAGAFAREGRVRLIDYERNRGKITVLNETVPRLRGEIIVFSDAASMLAADSVRRLVAHFADPRVGAVSGLYRVLKTEEAGLGVQEGLYWKYETWLKTQESALGAVLGAHGSMYAIRAKLYPFPENHVINDDYVIPLRILQRGYRVVYEPRAVASEEAREMEGFARRVRIMTGNVQQLRELWPLLWPPRPAPLFCFLSHKAGRLLVPSAMLLLALSNLALAGAPLYAWLGAAQAAFYLAALAGATAVRLPRVLRLPYYFCMINAAAVPALLGMLLPRKRMSWK